MHIHRMLDIGKSRVIVPRAGEHRKFDGLVERNLKFKEISLFYLVSDPNRYNDRLAPH